MKTLVYHLLMYCFSIVCLFSFAGCEDYRCQMETTIKPKVNIVGSGEQINVILEYNLGSIYVVDNLEGLKPVDSYYFETRGKDLEKINLRIKKGTLGLSSDGCYYIFDGTEYKGSKCISLKSLYDNRISLYPELQWSIFDEVEFKNGAPYEVITEKVTADEAAESEINSNENPSGEEEKPKLKSEKRL